MHDVTAAVMLPSCAQCDSPVNLMPDQTAAMFRMGPRIERVGPDQLIVSYICRVKELTVDPNQVIEGGRPNINTVNQLDLLDEEWLSISPQRDDLKLLCEQNVSMQSLFIYIQKVHLLNISMEK